MFERWVEAVRWLLQATPEEVEEAAAEVDQASDALFHPETPQWCERCRSYTCVCMNLCRGGG